MLKAVILLTKTKGYIMQEYIQNIKCPLLIIHGKKDKLIDSSHSQRLFDLAPVKDKSVIFIADVNHHDIYFKEINNPIILDWLQKFNIN